ncbi:hypothetical protein ACFS32_19380 [Novosphingobium pokkalii]|uniref:hypothetical protein n=1 Tax=Novosphingobium pokkalii TaxID=1770194 RepID=UPI003637545D
MLLSQPAAVLAQAQVPVGTGTSPDELAPPVKHQALFFARRITGYLPTRDGTLLRFSALLPKGRGRSRSSSTTAVMTRARSAARPT